MGKCTYAVSDFCEYANAHISAIGRHELELMKREITEAQEWDDAQEKPLYRGRLGMESDRINWLYLREVIREELKRRDDLKKEKGMFNLAN